MHRLEANGAQIPAIGLGTWTLRDAVATRQVAAAIDAGYRHIDTAAAYENEAAVGEGLRESGIGRDQVFVTTKVWPSDLADGDLQRSVEASLTRLGLDFVDLALIHWPPKNVALAEAIRALNEVRERGLARHIGVSNFTVALIEEAVALTAHPLACNQVEYHPYLRQDKVLAACRRHGLALVAYSPLGRGSELLAEPVVARAAQRHKKTAAQVVLRWLLQQEGVGAVPRSSRIERLEENLAVCDFTLEPEEMKAIAALQARRLRICDFEFSPRWDRD